MNQIEKKIADIIRGALPKINMDNITGDTEFEELGIESIDFIAIVIALEENFDIEITDELLIMQNMNTVKKIENILKLCGITEVKEFNE